MNMQVQHASESAPALTGTAVSSKPRATIYRMVMEHHICPYGLKALHLLRSRGFEPVQGKLQGTLGAPEEAARAVCRYRGEGVDDAANASVARSGPERKQRPHRNRARTGSRTPAPRPGRYSRAYEAGYFDHVDGKLDEALFARISEDYPEDLKGFSRESIACPTPITPIVTTALRSLLLPSTHGACSQRPSSLVNETSSTIYYRTVRTRMDRCPRPSANPLI